MFLIIGPDLRDPVGSLIPLMDLLLDEEEIKKNEKLVHIFNSFLNSVQQVSDLLENLLFWARNQDGELSYVREKINLNLIIEKALLLYKGIADMKQIKININSEKEFLVSADRDMVMLIIRNLISNAIKFTPRDGEIEIKLKEKMSGLKYSSVIMGLVLTSQLQRIFLKATTFLQPQVQEMK